MSNVFYISFIANNRQHLANNSVVACFQLIASGCYLASLGLLLAIRSA